MSVCTSGGSYADSAAAAPSFQKTAVSTVQSRGPSVNSRPKEANEDQLRAAMVIGVVRYTSWEKDFGDTLNICLVGESKSFQYISVLENSTNVVKKKTVRVSRIKSPTRTNVDACQVLVAGANVSSVLKRIQGDTPQFLICDQCNGLSKKASVILHKVDDRIRFDVHLNNAKDSGVHFRSSMLDIAHRVEGLDG